MRGDLINDWVRLSAEENKGIGVCYRCKGRRGKSIYRDTQNPPLFICAKCHIGFIREVDAQETIQRSLGGGSYRRGGMGTDRSPTTKFGSGY